MSQSATLFERELGILVNQLLQWTNSIRPQLRPISAAAGNAANDALQTVTLDTEPEKSRVTTGDSSGAAGLLSFICSFTS